MLYNDRGLKKLKNFFNLSLSVDKVLIVKNVNYDCPTR